VKWLKKLLRQIHEGLCQWFAPRYRTHLVEDSLPKRVSRRTLYVVQEDGFLEQAAMLCPCGCGRVLHMNLLPDERPCWRFIRHKDGTATLSPSVWSKRDCRSHFWFRQGRVHWCKASG
jgi:hypothetical protein